MEAVRIAAVVALAAAATGCASIAGAYEMSASARLDDKPSFQFDSPSIEEAFQRRAQLPVPARIAVCGAETSPYGRFADTKAVEFERALRDDGARWKTVDTVPSFLAGKDRGSVAALRRAAAQMHCDAILLYEQSVKMETSRSPMLLLNVLLFPAISVPTQPFEVALETEAALVDVRNGFVYLTLHDQRRVEGRAPTAYLDEWARDLKSEARGEAFAGMREELARRLARETATAPKAP